nr:helical hairpin domain-containing protein [Streptococcus pseudopneumoniae]
MGEKEIEDCQKQMNEYIDEYEHQVRRLEKLVNTINYAIDSKERGFNIPLE